MRKVVVTDAKYRSSIAAVRSLGQAGYHVTVTQTRGDEDKTPPVFCSKYVSETVWIEGKASDAEYADRLYSLLSGMDRPILFCVGAATLNTVSKNRERFSGVCDFLISEPHVLDALNDKEQVHERCEKLGIPAPKQYSGVPDVFPVVIKPHCGEKFGLKAKDRYVIASDVESYRAAIAKMSEYDPEPIVQQKIEGDGMGVSLLMGRESTLLGAICHRRIREYPVTGGPSTCCESFYDGAMIEKARTLLASFGFEGLAMVEFKGDCVLEVNPRIWGSFPLTYCAESPVVNKYAMASAGDIPAYEPCDYRPGVRMRFLINDTAAMAALLKCGRLRAFFGGVADVFRAREALSSRDDPKPMRRYLRNFLPGG